MFEYDKHFKQCQQHNQPFIKARKNPSDQNYFVLIDLITCNYDLSEEGKKKIDDLFGNETEYLKSISQNNSIFKGCNIDKELAWYDGILPSRLDIFCENLFDLSSKFNDLTKPN
jgi:hypothetical protein